MTPRSCRQCGADISSRGNRAVWCKRHGSKKNQQRRHYQKKAAKLKTERPPAQGGNAPTLDDPHGAQKPDAIERTVFIFEVKP